MSTETMIMRANKSNRATVKDSAPKSRGRVVSFEDFEPDSDLTESQRAAQFLDWAARNMPRRNVPYAWITKHAYIKPRLPRPSDPDIDTLRLRKMDQIKRVLWDVYNRRTVASPRPKQGTAGQESGVRATVDDEDMAGTDFLRNKRRVANGIKRLADTRQKMDPSKIRDAGLKAMVTNMDPVIKKLMEPDLLRRLELPPHPKSKTDDDE